MKKFYHTLFLLFSLVLYSHYANGQITVSAAVLKNVTCFGGNDGEIKVDVTSGPGPYTYILVYDFNDGFFQELGRLANETATSVTFKKGNGTLNDDNLGIPANLDDDFYRVTVIGNCVGLGCTRSTTRTITQPTQLTATVNDTDPACTPGTGTISLDVVGGSPNYSFAWTGPTVIGDIQNPSNLDAGTYSVTITDINGCSFSLSNIVIPSSPDATITPAGPFCSNNGAVTLSAVIAGGTWSGTGITDPSAGTFNPAIAGVGTHTITYSVTQDGCTSTDTEDVVVNTSPDATIIAAGPFCTTSPAINLTAATAGGTWGGTGITDINAGTFDPATAGAGSHVITYSITVAGCGTITDTEDIVVNTSPDATITAAGPFCTTSAAVNLTAATAGGTWSGTGITDVNAGTFDPATAGSGSHVITYSITVAGCGTFTDTENIVVNTSPDATITAAGPFCTTSAAVNLIAATAGGTWSGTGITNASLGTFNPATAGSGTHTITYSITVPGCGIITDTENIVVNTSPDATITPAGPFCTTSAAVNLTAAAAGGTWSGTGITNASLGTFNPATAGVGTHTITYSITVPGCGTVTDTEDIVVNTAPDVTITAAGPFCTTSAAVNLTAATAGGTWSGTGITNASLGTFNPTTAGAGTHTITYSITVPGCGIITDTENIVVNTSPDATITAAGPFCTTSAAINLTAATAGGTWSGTGITNASLGTFNPATAGVGTHTITYSITVSGCGTVTDTEDIVVNAAPDVTVTAAGPFCTTSAAVNLTAATAGGTWSGTGITDVNAGTFNPATAGAGTHAITYSITVPGCGTITDTENIVVNTSPDATITASGPFCTTSAAVNLAAATAGGTWSGTGITNPSLGTFNPATAGVGSHVITYSITVAGCGTFTDTENIVVNTSPDATITAAGPFCTTSAAVNLIAATVGGTWSGTGITDINAGTFDPATAGAGTHAITYSITVAGCGTITDTENIVVNATPDATITAAGPFCTTSAAVNLTAATAGGTWSGTGISNPSLGTFNPATAGAGSHVITYSITVTGCGTITDTENIVVNTSPDATITAAGPFCTTSSAVNLIAATAGGTWSGTGITDVNAGTFDPATAGAGTHAITYSITVPGCGIITDTENIVVNTSPDATITAAGPFCTTSAAINLTAATAGGTWSGTGITNASLGTFNPATAGVGTHTITYSITVPGCGIITDTENIVVNTAPDATITAAGPFCTTSAAVNLTTATAGGTWSGTGITNASLGTFNPATAGVGTHTITYSITVPGCGIITDTENIVVNTAPDATITATGPFCTTSAAVNLTAATAGGTWSGTGITNASLGTFNPATAGSGTHTITYSITVPGCGTVTDTEDIVVNTSPDATITAAGPFCTTSSAVNLIAATAGGTWSGTGITDVNAGTFDPATAGAGTHAITYSITVAGCGTLTDTENIVVNTSPDATITAAGPFCMTSAAVNLTAATAGGTWSGTGITDANAGTFDPATAGAGTHAIAYSITVAGCGTFTDTENIVVNTSPDATITAAGPFCTTSAAVNLTAATAGGTWSGTGITDVNAGTFDPATAGAGSHVITYSITVAGCGTITDTENIVVNTSPDATITGAGPFCTTSPTINLTAATTGGTWSGTGITDANAGTFDPATAGAGSHAITYSITVAGCGTFTDTENIVVNTSPDATITVAGPFCTTSAAVNLTAATAGGTWSGTGITDVNAGTFDPATAGAGTHAITYSITVAGCGTFTDTENIVVNTSPDATITAAGPFCTSSAAVNLTAATAGGTWSGTGITDVNAGTFDPATAGAGTHAITYSITVAGCGTFTDTENIVVNTSPDATITAAGPFCTTSAAVNLIAATVGGTWSGTGITDVNAGTFDPATAGARTHAITYSITVAGCGTITDTENIVVNPAPTIDAGIPQTVCAGAPVPIVGTRGGGATSSIWTTDGDGTFSNNLQLSTNYMPGLNDVAAGTVKLFLTTNDPAGPCTAVQDEVIITILSGADPNLTVTVVNDPLCQGGAGEIRIDNSQNGVDYQLRYDADDSNAGMPVTGTGGTISLFTPSLSATTTFNIFASLAGCTSAELNTKPVVTVSGSIDLNVILSAEQNPVCSGSSTNIELLNPENGVTYQLRNDFTNADVGTPVTAGVASIDLPTGPVTNTTRFHILASNGSCSSLLNGKVTVLVENDLIDPTVPVSVTIDPVCSGGMSEIKIDNSTAGVFYQLRNDVGDINVGSEVEGDGGTIYLPTGPLTITTTFNVLARNNGTGACPPVELPALLTVNVNGNIDAGLTVTAVDNPLCEGTSTNIRITASETGVSYQLRNDADDSDVGAAVTGTGGDIDLPTGNLSATTTFNILASIATCSIELTTLTTINVEVAPDPGLIISVAINPLCSGGQTEIRIDNSETGVAYQLRNHADNSAVGTPVNGDGGTILLPTGVLTATTTFNVLATSGTACSPVQLTALATVTVGGTVNDALTVTAVPATICPGESSFIEIQSSETGVDYQLRLNADNSTVGTVVAGTGSTISLPTGNLTSTTAFNVLAGNGACAIQLTNTATVTVNPSPDATLAVTASPSTVCNGTGSAIIITNAEAGVSYQLRNDAGDLAVGSPVTGAGADLSFPTGNLSVNTTFNVLATLGTCSVELTQTATVTVQAVGSPGCGGGGGSDCNAFTVFKVDSYVRPSCTDQDNGSISIRVEGGNPNYILGLEGNNFSQQVLVTGPLYTFSNLSPDENYKYSVTDANGNTCELDYSLVVQPTVSATAEDIQNALCPGGYGTTVLKVISGGNSPYQYFIDGSWTSFVSGDRVDVPSSGSFNILVRDDEFDECPSEIPVTVTSASLITYQVTAVNDVSTCNGTDGAFTISDIQGGSGSYQIRLLIKSANGLLTILRDFTNVQGNEFTYDGLDKGAYVIVLKDANDCHVNNEPSPININAPGSIDFNVTNPIPADCSNNAKSGKITLEFNSGGNYLIGISKSQAVEPAYAPFTYSTGDPDLVIDTLSQGSYFVFVKPQTGDDCPTVRTTPFIGGAYALSFDIETVCSDGAPSSLNFINVFGDPNRDLLIKIFRKGDSVRPVDEIEVSFASSFQITGKPFLGQPDDYYIELLQKQTICTDTIKSSRKLHSVTKELSVVLGEVSHSLPDPRQTGSIPITDIIGGTPFTDEKGQYYMVTLKNDFTGAVEFGPVALYRNAQGNFETAFQNIGMGNYTVEVLESVGCSIAEQKSIEFDTRIIVPNIFTPNDDMINDLFEIVNLPSTGKHKLVISNRWGNQVFASNDYREGGFWNASGAPEGIYFYRLQIEGGETLSGWVEIVRGTNP